MNLFCVGISHHTADVETRERFAGHAAIDRILREEVGCSEALLLTTCNRVEVYAAAAEPDAARRKQLYSQLNDYILDQSFGLPIAPSTSRVITKASVHGIEFRMNDVMTFSNAWIG